MEAVKKKNQVDMLHGPLILKILMFALPIAASSILQQLFNSADVAVVGRFAGQEALAAVGANTPIVTMFVTTFTGLALGTNVVLAQYIGQNRTNKVRDVVHTSLVLGLIMGLLIFLIGQFSGRALLLATGAPENVLDQAVIYLKVYMASMPFMAVYNFGAAVLRSIGDTRRPMYILIFTGLLNVIMNLIFVILLHLGVVGVALATVIANLISMLLIIRILMTEQELIRVYLDKLRIDRESLFKIIIMGGPAAIQSMLFSFSNVCLQAGINSFGTKAIAGSAAALNFEYFDYYMVNSFNQAAVTFMGQNFAAGDKGRCRKVFMICLMEGLAGISILIISFFMLKGFFISLFTTDPEVVAFAYERMLCVLSTHFLICFYEITGSAIRGMGKSMLPTVIMILGSVVFRLCWIATIFQHWNSYRGLLLVYPCSWIFTGMTMMTAFFILYRKYLREKS